MGINAAYIYKPRTQARMHTQARIHTSTHAHTQSICYYVLNAGAVFCIVRIDNPTSHSKYLNLHGPKWTHHPNRYFSNVCVLSRLPQVLSLPLWKCTLAYPFHIPLFSFEAVSSDGSI